MNLTTLLREEHMLIGLDATSKKRVFEEIGFLFERTAQLNRTVVTDSLFARERLASTGLGRGVAIPHGRIKGLKEPYIAVIQLLHPIGFDAVDNAPVQLLLALLVPENAAQKHLDLLSQIAQLLSDETCSQALQMATSTAQIKQIIVQALQSEDSIRGDV